MRYVKRRANELEPNWFPHILMYPQCSSLKQRQMCLNGPVCCAVCECVFLTVRLSLAICYRHMSPVCPATLCWLVKKICAHLLCGCAYAYKACLLVLLSCFCWCIDLFNVISIGTSSLAWIEAKHYNIFFSFFSWANLQCPAQDGPLQYIKLDNKYTQVKQKTNKDIQTKHSDVIQFHKIRSTRSFVTSWLTPSFSLGLNPIPVRIQFGFYR